MSLQYKYKNINNYYNIYSLNIYIQCNIIDKLTFTKYIYYFLQ
jgi:hypothetical protein